MKCTRKEEYVNASEEELDKMEKSEYLNNHYVFAD